MIKEPDYWSTMGIKKFERMRNSICMTFICIFCFGSQSYAQNIEPLVNGRVVKLAPKVAQTVRVRAQSVGPGLCNVDVRLASDATESVNFNATPFVMSDWFDLFVSLGSTGVESPTYKILLSENCDTGAMFEISYYSD